MRSQSVALILLIMGVFSSMAFAQPPGPPRGAPQRALELERALKNHPQQDKERVDLLLKTRRQPGLNRAGLILRGRAHEALSISKRLNYLKGEAGAYEKLAISFDPFEEADSLLFYYTKAYELYTELGDESDVMNAYLGIGKGLASLRRFQEALDVYLEVLDYYEVSKDYHSIGNVYGFIGLLYMNQAESGTALVNFKKSVAAFDKAGDDTGVERVLNDLAQAYLFEGEYEKALEAVNQAIEKVEAIRRVPVPFYVTRGKILFNVGDLEAAKENFLQARTMASGRGWIKSQVLVYYYLAQIEFEQGDFVAAKQDVEEALRLNEEINPGANLAGHKFRLLNLLAQAEHKLGDSGEAYNHLLVASELRDSLTIEENLKALADIQTKYETEKKEQEILLLQSEKKAKQRLFILIILGIVSVFAVVGNSFWQATKRKQQERQLKFESVQREMEQYGVLIAEKDSFINGVIEKLNGFKKYLPVYESRKELQTLIDSLRHNVDLIEDEEQLFQRIEQVNMGLFHKLEEQAGSLNNREKRLASLASMGLSNKEIGNILGINPRSAMQAKFRLKKKLNLAPEIDLQEYLKSIPA